MFFQKKKEPEIQVSCEISHFYNLHYQLKFFKIIQAKKAHLGAMSHLLAMQCRIQCGL